MDKEKSFGFGHSLFWNKENRKMEKVFKKMTLYKIYFMTTSSFLMGVSWKKDSRGNFLLKK